MLLLLDFNQNVNNVQRQISEKEKILTKIQQNPSSVSRNVKCSRTDMANATGTFLRFFGTKVLEKNHQPQFRGSVLFEFNS